MKIISITEKIPQATTLPDGIYEGSWGGYIINLTYKNKHYELTTEKGVKTIGCKVMVTIKGGVATFETVNN